MMRMVGVLTVGALLAAGGCAVVEAPPAMSPMLSTPSTGTLSSLDVAKGFVLGTVDGCAAAAETGKPIEQLGNASIVRDMNRDPMQQPRAGEIAWAPIPGQGIVTINEGATSCSVSAYGPPVQSTFDAIVSALTAKGYQSLPAPTEGFRHFAANLSKSVNGRTVKVTLLGNEPGASGRMSRFSGLSAFVGVTTP